MKQRISYQSLVWARLNLTRGRRQSALLRDDSGDTSVGLGCKSTFFHRAPAGAFHFTRVPAYMKRKHGELATKRGLSEAICHKR